MLKIETNTHKRVSKTAAIKHYNAGNPIFLLPHKVGPGNMWIQMCQIDYKPEENVNLHIQYYQYYNCSAEVGMYPAYYIAK